MRMFEFFVASLLAAAMAVPACAASEFPAGAEALEARLLAKMGVQTRAWIADEAARIAASHFPSDALAVGAAQRYGAKGADLDALAFLALMQAQRDADASVSNVVTDVQSANGSREDARQAQLRRDSITGARRSDMSGGQQEASEAQGSTFVNLTPTAQGGTATIGTAGTATAEAAPRQSGSLQDAMDREAQIADLVEDAMKKLAQTSDSLVQPMS
jgi:hypothetical protein